MRFTLRELESFANNPKRHGITNAQVKQIKTYLRSKEAKERRARGLKRKITMQKNNPFKTPSINDLMRM